MRASSLAIGAAILLGATLGLPNVGRAQYPDACRNAVQGKVPWNGQGDRNWAPANIERLCRGGVGEEPARCMDRVMRGNINWGGGTKWEWENAVNLCHGAQDANATITCFEGQMRAHIPWQQAIPNCANAAPPPPADPMAVCRSAVQGKVPWNGQGDTSWAPANIERLCRGGLGDQPARCMERVMRGNINWGGGTKWEWENAVNLCRGSQDANANITCFEGQMRAQIPWQQAIPNCNNSAPQQQQQPPPPPPPPVDPIAACRGAVQGRVAWNGQGDTNWAPANIERLCRGGLGDQPARCMERVMRGNINWGGGTKWEWENAVNLCRGSQDANANISCFEGQMRAHIPWQQAIPNCNNSGQPQQPIAAPPPVDSMEQCRAAVQGRVPWNSNGDTQWAPANIERLCRGGAGEEPARCMERVMRGNISWGGGTKWEWENAVDLCHGSQNHHETIRCFEGQIRRGVQWKPAIQACRR